MENAGFPNISDCLDTTGGELRRYRTDMLSAGFAVILLGVWSVIKGIYYLITQKNILTELYLEGTGLPQEDYDLIHRFVVAFFVVFILIVVVLRLHVGRRAIKEGWGLSKKRGYLIIAVGMLLVAINGFVTALSKLLIEDEVFDAIATLFLEATDIYALSRVIICSFRLKRIYMGNAPTDV